MNNVVNLDWILEEPKPAAQVELAGEKYDLIAVNVVEDLLSFSAIGERAKSVFERASGGGAGAGVEEISQVLDEVARELRRMIRALVPGISEETLLEHFPRVSQLQRVFIALTTAVGESLPESVKKNSEADPAKEPLQAPTTAE